MEWHRASHVDVFAPSRVGGAFNQGISPLVTLKDTKACPIRLGRNQRQNGIDKQGLLNPVPGRDVLGVRVRQQYDVPRLTRVADKTP